MPGVSGDCLFWCMMRASSPGAIAVTAAFHALQRPGAGPDANLALMAAALRAKYTQHKDLTKALLATDGRIEYANGIDGFWTSYRGGRNWIGRLLELVRAELRARR